MLFICPYCHARAVPEPPDIPRPHATCTACGMKPRAVITYTHAGEKQVRYVKDGRHKGEETVLISVRVPVSLAAGIQGDRTAYIVAALKAYQGK